MASSKANRLQLPLPHEKGRASVEVGHVGQNIHLQAEALGLGTVAVGAFDGEMVRRVVEVEKGIEPLYIMPLGKPA